MLSMSYCILEPFFTLENSSLMHLVAPTKISHSERGGELDKKSKSVFTFMAWLRLIDKLRSSALLSSS